MPLIDILIAIVLIISVAVGVARGFVKEAISIATLLFAIWAAFYFGPDVGEVAENWVNSPEMQTWVGRLLVFVIVLALGGLLGWAIAKLVRLSVLSGIDRLVGAVFGAGRGILFIALFVLAGQFAGFEDDRWWQESKALPHFQPIAEWITVMAPQGYDLLLPDSPPASLPIEMD